MSTYASIHLHVIFSTKHRQPWIAGEWRGSLHAYLGGCIRTLEAVPEAIGGTEDHVHLLIGLKTKHSISDVIREVKKISTAWVKTEFRVNDFAWQEGYAAISVSPRDRPMMCGYIANQETRHHQMSAIDELKALLEEAGIPYDPSYLV